ncbi:MAG TPA: RNA-binding S4 domain-containing protein [Arachidicoccus soli]|nr:RNA-binding S4 domain-containing protein [Arachidicoccus soli]
MEILEFKLEGEYIELIQLLKAINIAQTGGHAKIIVENGLVYRDGLKELRKRAKIRIGDTIEVDQTIKIIII